MKKGILILSMIMALSIFAKAQKAPPTITEITNKSMESLDKKLKLNPTQRSIIYNYTLDLSKEQVGLYKKQVAGTYTEDDIARFYKMQNETTKNIRNVLKGEQQTDYDKLVEEQLRGGDKKKKKGKHAKEEEEVVTGIEGLKLPPGNQP
jgi:protein CpxP